MHQGTGIHMEAGPLKSPIALTITTTTSKHQRTS